MLKETTEISALQRENVIQFNNECNQDCIWASTVCSLLLSCVRGLNPAISPPFGNFSFRSDLCLGEKFEWMHNKTQQEDFGRFPMFLGASKKSKGSAWWKDTMVCLSIILICMNAFFMWKNSTEMQACRKMRLAVWLSYLGF